MHCDLSIRESTSIKTAELARILPLEPYILEYSRKEKEQGKTSEPSLNGSLHGERGGEGEMYGESNMETYIKYVKYIANGNLLNGSGDSNRGSVST